MFLAKYGTNGGLQWLARSTGRFAEGRGIIVDAAGNVFLTGSFRNSLLLESSSFTAAGSDDVSDPVWIDLYDYDARRILTELAFRSTDSLIHLLQDV